MWLTKYATFGIILLAMACGSSSGSNGGAQAVTGGSGGSSNAAGGFGGTSASLDAGVPAFTGSYGVAFSGDSMGQLSLKIGSDRHAMVYALDTSTGTQVLVTETDLTPQGGATFTVVGALGTATYQGNFRFDGANAFGWGSWVSTSGSKGVWGAFRDNNNYGFTSGDIDQACTRSDVGGLCSSTSHAETVAQCSDRLPCRLGFVGANGAECLSMLSLAVRQIVAATTAADCPDMSGAPPAQWNAAGCVADMGACSG